MIKKLFIISSILLTAYFTNAQETRFSFEGWEGFTLGQFNEQKNWNNWGFVDNDHSQIIESNLATNGENVVRVIANEDEQENWGGILYPAPNYNNMSISADVYLEGIGGSDYDMLSLYYWSNENEEHEYISSFYFDFEENLTYGTEETYVTSKDKWTPNKWYNLKTNINFKNKKMEFFIDNTKVLTADLPEGVSYFDEVDFEFDNYVFGFLVDNVKIQNLDNLAIDELSAKKTTTIYPNPVKDILNINSNSEIKSVIITDAIGRVILNGNSKSVNVEDLKQGVYFVNIKTDDNEYSEKFIKK